MDYLEVTVSIDWEEQKWRTNLKDVTKEGDAIGWIEGVITREEGTKIFIVEQSELEEAYQGKGIGFFLYTETIKKCLKFCDEFNSSTQLNDYSTGTWEAMKKRYYNVERRGKKYIVKKKNIKGILL